MRWLVILMAAAGTAAAPAPIEPDIAAWLFTGNRAAPPPSGWDAVRPLAVPGSTARFTQAQLHDLQRAVDWYPQAHPPMPAIVAQGRAPEVKACGFCHLPGGGGRPENASLAGLDHGYIEAQVAAFADGTRRAAVPEWIPTHTMSETARAATPAEIHTAAVYFESLHYVSRVRVVETATVPRLDFSGFTPVPAPGGGREPIAGRLIEMPDDVERFERRDPLVGYTAYVPPGTLAKGAAVMRRIGCPACHGPGSKLWNAGRSPSYMVRQLLAFRSGARHDPGSPPMRAVAARLTTADIIAVAGYWASLKP